jgi:hypothetical protein
MSLDDMIARGELESVDTDVAGARDALGEARLHVASARAIASSDSNGAYQLAYDGARKAVMASMRSAGIRVRKGEGAHALTAAYAEVAIDEGLGQRLDAMRKRRNRSEYGSAFFSEAAVSDGIALAEALIEAVPR